MFYTFKLLPQLRQTFESVGRLCLPRLPVAYCLVMMMALNCSSEPGLEMAFKCFWTLTLLHSEWPKPYGVLAFLSVVVALLFYVHGKHLRSCRDGQLT